MTIIFDPRTLPKSTEDWPVVECQGVSWRVRPVPLAPVSRGELQALCEAWGCEIPSRSLCLEIWQAADLRLDAAHLVRSPSTFANMATPRAYADQEERILAMVGDQEFTLLGGSHKDHAIYTDGAVDLFGWWTLAGLPLQPGRTSHGPAYVDYSGSWRPVQRVA